MKKIFILMMALIMSFCVANAQLATENSKFFDNTYVGVGGQASTPLDFNGALPLNGGVSVVLGKQLTPVFGVNIEDNVWLGMHCIILPQVSRIGKNAIVGAGAIVTRDVPPNTVVAGNPAKIIRNIKS